jgi:hypothetical protein
MTGLDRDYLQDDLLRIPLNCYLNIGTVKLYFYNIRFNLGLGVMPGILPRLAIGLPATS